MKNIKSYNNFNESLKDKLKGKSEEDVINSFVDMNKLLEDSIRKNFLNGVKTALKKGADINYLGGYPLRVAILDSNLDMVKYLVDNGADIHLTNNFAIRQASDLDMVKYFIKKGADVHVNEDTPLRMASYYGNIEVVKYLLDNFEFDLDIIEKSIVNAKTGGYNNIVVLLNQYIDKKKLY